MAKLVSAKARKLAKVVGWTHTVVHGVGLLFAIGFLLSTLWMGYNLYGNDSFAKISDDDYSRQMASADYRALFGISGTFTALSFTISGPQSYGAYLLLKATNVNMKGSEAIVKVNSFRKIQLVFLCIDFGIIIPTILMVSDNLFALPILFILTLFVCHYISVQAVEWFRSDLKIASAGEFKRAYNQKAVEKIAHEPFVISIYKIDKTHIG
ncbi:unnamed protein product [Orchesella dallaii]|uniref:Uncharacterized protein n=1 Tax=Orchesella dallaii TaxID=48710 RepID=A0ABP1PJ08_9HEXA